MYDSIDTEEQLYEVFESLIQSKPPRCIQEFRLTKSSLPVKWDDNFHTCYQVGCECGCTTGELFGYPLKDFSENYNGDDFIPVFSFQCTDCKKIKPCIDSSQHGYHAELDLLEGKEKGGIVICGSGDPTRIVCPHCQNCTHQLFMGFIFWDFDLLADVVYDGLEAHPDAQPAKEIEILEHPQDFFNCLAIEILCENCKKITLPFAGGKL